MNKRPNVSIIMPLFRPNLEYLKESIDSIVEQSYKGWELIVVDDSADDEVQNFIVQNYPDEERIRYIHNTSRMGIGESINIGISDSIGTYVARMDADDVCFRNRLKMQVKQLDKMKNIDILGSNTISFGDENRFNNIRANNETIRARLLSRSPFYHPTVIMRKQRLIDNKLKYPNIRYCEDYSFWIQCAISDGDIRFCSTFLPTIKYRVHEMQGSKNSSANIEMHRRCVRKLLGKVGLTITDDQLADFCFFDHEYGNLTRNTIKSYCSVAKMICASNRTVGFWNSKSLRKEFNTRIIKEIVHTTLRKKSIAYLCLLFITKGKEYHV